MVVEREHANRLVFSPGAGLDPHVDLALAGAQLRALVQGRASAWQQHITLTPTSAPPGEAVRPAFVLARCLRVGGWRLTGWQARTAACARAGASQRLTAAHHLDAHLSAAWQSCEICLCAERVSGRPDAEESCASPRHSHGPVCCPALVSSAAAHTAVPTAASAAQTWQVLLETLLSSGHHAGGGI